MIPYQNTHNASTQKKGKKGGVLTILRETKRKKENTSTLV